MAYVLKLMVVVPDWPTVTGVGLVSEITYMDNHGKPVGKEPCRSKTVIMGNDHKTESDLQMCVNVMRQLPIGNVIDRTLGKKELIHWKPFDEKVLDSNPS